MLAIVIPQITGHKLSLHRRLDLAVPAAFRLNDDLEMVELLAARTASHGIHVDVCPFCDMNLHLSIENDASLNQRILKFDLYPIGQRFFVFGAVLIPQEWGGGSLCVKLLLQTHQRVAQNVQQLTSALDEAIPAVF